MSNRGLAMISVVSGLIAVLVFILVVVAYLGSGGSSTPIVSSAAPVVKASPGQPVDSDFVFTSGGNEPATPGPTVQPVSPSGGQAAVVAPTTQQPVEAPSASAPANPFTAGIH